MLHLDGPDHKRLRSLVAKAFNAQSIEAMRGKIKEIADRLLDAVEGQSSFDVVDAYSKPLPTIVIATMRGVNESIKVTLSGGPMIVLISSIRNARLSSRPQWIGRRKSSQITLLT